MIYREGCIHDGEGVVQGQLVVRGAQFADLRSMANEVSDSFSVSKVRVIHRQSLHPEQKNVPPACMYNSGRDGQHEP